MEVIKIPILSDEEVIKRIHKWIRNDVKKSDVDSVLWAIMMADIDASVMKSIERRRKEHNTKMATSFYF